MLAAGGAWCCCVCCCANCSIRRGPCCKPGRACAENGTGRRCTNWRVTNARCRAVELLAALAAFLIPAALLLANATAAAPLTVASLGLVLLVGLLRGLPRWSLLYFGLALGNSGALFFFGWVLEKISPLVMARFAPMPGDAGARLVMQAFTTGLLWLGLFACTFLLLGLLSLLRRFRRTYWRIRSDWTLASFILYGEAVFLLVLMFAEYRHETPYALSALALLAAGACFFLRRPGRWPRCYGSSAG